MSYSHLLPFCLSEAQSQLIESIEQHGSPSAAAKYLGRDERNCRRSFTAIKARAAKSGQAPEAGVKKPIAEGYQIAGTSTLYGKDGEQKLQWIKTNQDRDAQIAAIQAMVEALKEDIAPALPVSPPAAVSNSLLTQYTITDYHLGMYAWKDETGADWDMRIAESLLIKWFSTAIEQSPASEKAVFCQLGDFLHWDGMEAKTNGHGHILDADSRFAKLVRVSIRVIRNIIAMLLAKHKEVHIIMACGNHDESASYWLREMLHAFYEDEPRITVDTNPDLYYAVEFGNVSLFYHHGHKKRHGPIAETFAAKFREMLGRTKYSYAHTGHYHHQKVDETALMTIEQHNTLAAPDAYATHGGWISKRNAKVITYHREFGEVGRLTVSPEMVG